MSDINWWEVPLPPHSEMIEEALRLQPDFLAPAITGDNLPALAAEKRDVLLVGLDAIKLRNRTAAQAKDTARQLRHALLTLAPNVLTDEERAYIEERMVEAARAVVAAAAQRLTTLASREY